MQEAFRRGAGWGRLAGVVVKRLSFEDLDPLLDLARRSTADGSSPFVARTAAFQLVDYYKCLLVAFGQATGFPISESQSVDRKFEIAVGRAPQLKRWQLLIDEVGKLRAYVAHHELQTPSSASLAAVLHDTDAFRSDLMKEAKVWTSGTSISSLMASELSACAKEIERMRTYFGSHMNLDPEADGFESRRRYIEQLKAVLEKHSPELLSGLLDQVKAISKEAADLVDAIASDFIADQRYSEMKDRRAEYVAERRSEYEV